MCGRHQQIVYEQQVLQPPAYDGGVFGRRSIEHIRIVVNALAIRHWQEGVFVVKRYSGSTIERKLHQIGCDLAAGTADYYLLYVYIRDSVIPNIPRHVLPDEFFSLVAQWEEEHGSPTS